MTLDVVNAWVEEINLPTYGIGQPGKNPMFLEKRVSQGLARRKLGRETEARMIFDKLVDYGQTHLNDEFKLDYFAISLPDFLVFDEDLNQRNRLHCHYLMALGYLGLGDETAALHFDEVLALDINHQGAVIHRALLRNQGGDGLWA